MGESWQSSCEETPGWGGVAACMVGICSHQSPSVIADEEEDGPGLLTGRVRGGQGLQITDLLTVQ